MSGLKPSPRMISVTYGVLTCRLIPWAKHRGKEFHGILHHGQQLTQALHPEVPNSQGPPGYRVRGEDGEVLKKTAGSGWLTNPSESPFNCKSISMIIIPKDGKLWKIEIIWLQKNTKAL